MPSLRKYREGLVSTWKWIVGGSIVGLAAGKILSKKSGPSASTVSLPALKDWGVPFATPTGRVWPVVGGARFVPYTTPSGTVNGNSATAFHASREGSTRFHAGIDLQATPAHEIVAMEDGIVLGNVPGFVHLDAAVVQHASCVAVYAEISYSELTKGTRVHAGDLLGHGALNADGNSMLHLELWQLGFAPKGFVPWYSKNPPPAGLYDPTKYLLALSKVGG
jgi:murein DD-endopeptidase MepM/ murein hydrolase activator NlpD